MKKAIIGITIVGTIAGATILPNLAAPTKVTVTYDDVEIKFPDAQPVIDENNRVILPVRFVAETLGAKVEWDDKRKKVTIKNGSDEITMRIDDTDVVVNGRIKTIDTKSVLKDGRTFVPVRFVSEALGCNVAWEADLKNVAIWKTIRVTPQPKPTPSPTATVVGTAGKYEPSKWVQVDGEGKYTEMYLNISWTSNLEKFNAYCDYAEMKIAEKLNKEIAKKVVDLARKKTDRSIRFVESTSYNGKEIEIEVFDSSISITFWKVGVK